MPRSCDLLRRVYRRRKRRRKRMEIQLWYSIPQTYTTLACWICCVLLFTFSHDQCSAAMFTLHWCDLCPWQPVVVCGFQELTGSLQDVITQTLEHIKGQETGITALKLASLSLEGYPEVSEQTHKRRVSSRAHSAVKCFVGKLSSYQFLVRFAPTDMLLLHFLNFQCHLWLICLNKSNSNNHGGT